MTQRELAIYYAGNFHGDQQYGEGPYIIHLTDVDGVLDEAGYSIYDVLRVAAWLHDVCEDCGVENFEIDKTFGPAVADLVWRVTNESGENRKERSAKTYPKIAGDQRAIALKLADRIANLRHGLKNHSRKGLMYVKEDPAFKAALMDIPCTDMRVDWLWAQYNLLIAEIKKKYGI
jgi:guanosine-3',5'-bis(diphosphate) 3'-pyrophosphohydrolase